MRTTAGSPMMKRGPRPLLAAAFGLAAVSLLGCSSDAPSPPAGASGGVLGASGGSVTGSGGRSGTGGATGPGWSGGATGGVAGAGGATASRGGTLGEGGTGGGGTGASNAGGNSDAAAGGAGGSSAAADAGTGGRMLADGAPGGDTADTRPISTDAASTGGATSSGGSTATGGKTGGSTGGSTAGATGAGGSAAGGTTGTGGATGGSDGKTPITVWMAGDSTMAGDKCAGGGWGDQLGALLNGNVKVDNRSVAGRSIQTWLYEKNVSSTMGSNNECTLTANTYSDNWNAMLDATSGMKKGDYLFIEFGINDGDSSCPRHVGTTLFQTYLATMAKAAKDRGTQPVFLTSTSYIECSGQTATANRGFRAETKAAGTANDVPVIDMSALSAALYTKAGLCPNSGDYTSTTSKVGVFFCNDHTHFAEPGAIEIARVATTAVKDQGIGLASYIK